MIFFSHLRINKIIQGIADEIDEAFVIRGGVL
jgi:hypothetical protein